MVRGQSIATAAVATQPKAPQAPAPKIPKNSGAAIRAYEMGLKFMHAEEYSKALKAFKEILANYGDEPEIQERARVLMQAAEKKLHGKPVVVKSAEEHYNMGIAELNRRETDSAVRHFQDALKLAPKSEHILYAMAAAHAVRGDRDNAITFLKQSIQYRPENRFLASKDSDFEPLRDDPEFQQLLATPNKP